MYKVEVRQQALTLFGRRPGLRTVRISTGW
jgi:hypothetical protein